MPGAASGSGGGAATLGYDSKTRLTPLTVNLGEFAAQVNAENREVIQFGAFFQWSSKVREEHNVPLGPANPQALNRYAYCLNNPLRYVDPTGHYLVNTIDVDLTADQVNTLIAEINTFLGLIDQIECAVTLSELAGKGIAAYETSAILAKYVGIKLTIEIGKQLIGTKTIAASGKLGATPYAAALSIWGAKSIDNLKDDLNDLRFELAMASKAGTQGVHLRMGTNLVHWGIEVNGVAAVNHLNLPLGVPGMLATKGQANFMPAFMLLWKRTYLSD